MSSVIPSKFTLARNPNPVSDEQRLAVLQSPGFGGNMTDHMVSIDYTDAGEWRNARVEPYGPISLYPSAKALHYGQAIFEGLKVFRHAGGSIHVFRPEANAARFIESAKRLAMPPLPEELFLESIRELVGVDQAWVPAADGMHSLYLRPFMFATEAQLMARRSSTYRFMLLAGPVGPVFKGGVKPVTVWVSSDYVRAIPGGTGAAKCAGNYAGTLLAQAEAEAAGCDQVVWLDAVERKYIEEMGGMNVCFVYGTGKNARIVTPPLNGSILPGVTRDALLTIARELGLAVEERRISVDDWRAAAESGEMAEAFACGTAAVVTPIGFVRTREGEFAIGAGQSGETTMRLREEITAIQSGRRPDNHNWLVRMA